MRMRTAFWVAVMGLWSVAWAAPKPSAWVPARWPWTDAASLDLLQGSPVNCLLLSSYSPEFLSAASQRGLVTLAVIAPGSDPAPAVKKAAAAKLDGIVLD